jgi:hypothetical protein
MWRMLALTYGVNSFITVFADKLQVIANTPKRFEFSPMLMVVGTTL